MENGILNIIEDELDGILKRIDNNLNMVPAQLNEEQIIEISEDIGYILVFMNDNEVSGGTFNIIEDYLYEITTEHLNDKRAMDEKEILEMRKILSDLYNMIKKVGI